MSAACTKLAASIYIPPVLRREATEVYKNCITEYEGTEMQWLAVYGHLDQQSLGYVLRLGSSAAALAAVLAKKMNEDFWEAWDGGFTAPAEYTFLTFHLSHNRQAGFTDTELELLSTVFGQMPGALAHDSYKVFDDLRRKFACERRWHLESPGGDVQRLHWDLKSTAQPLEFVAELKDVLL